MSAAKVDVRYVEMKGEMEKDAIEVAREAMKKYASEKEIATYVKTQFDEKHEPIWHCIAGRSFGSYVTHQAENIIYFYIDDLAFLIFKSR